MNVYLISRKVLQAVFLILFVVVILYVLLRLMPGNPAELYIRNLKHPTKAAINNIYKMYGINPNNKFALSSFIVYLHQMLTFHFGYNPAELSQSIYSMIATALPYTLIIFGVASVGSFAIGIPLGIVTAFIRGKKSEGPTLVTATILNSIPFFVMAIIVYLIFAVYYPIFPLAASHYRLGPFLRSPSFSGFLVLLHYFAMPILTLLIIEIMGHLITMRSIMVSVLGEDFIQTAKAKGVSESSIMFHHAARNAMVPESTRMALEFALLMSGAVITGIIFEIPGMGILLYDNILIENYPVIEASLFILSLVVIVSYSSIDFIHAWLDPRVRV